RRSSDLILEFGQCSLRGHGNVLSTAADKSPLKLFQMKDAPDRSNMTNRTGNACPVIISRNKIWSDNQSQCAPMVLGKRQASSPSNICTGWLGMIVEIACL